MTRWPDTQAPPPPTLPSGTLRPLWAEHAGRDWEDGPLCLHPTHPHRPRYSFVTSLGTWPSPRSL